MMPRARLLLVIMCLLTGAAAFAPAGADDEAASNPAIVAGLIGSKHDFAPRGAPLFQHCVACHGPPRNVAQTDTPAAASAASSQAVDVTPAEDRPATRCVVCHDGSIAGYISSSDSEGPSLPRGPQIDVRHDHPVGIVYPRGDRSYRPAASVRRAGVPLPNNRVECISCHDPHNAFGQPAMLVMSNRRSALCLTCHVK